MAHLTILRAYADRVDPNTLPPTIKLCHTDATLTIFDIYPKSTYHHLLIPFIRPPLKASDLNDIRSVLQLPREQAKALLQRMRRDALEAKALIEEEMVREHGFKWGIQMGFHAVPSLQYVPIAVKHIRHLHLHIMSTEFCGPFMKTKKHMNSFHPKVGFFLHIDEVLSWFEPDIAPTWFKMKAEFDKKEYEKLLKQDMTCPHCDKPYKSMAKLKEHLDEVWRKMVKEHAETPAEISTGHGSKRKHGTDAHEPGDADGQDDPQPASPPAKRQQTGAAADSPTHDPPTQDDSVVVLD